MSYPVIIGVGGAHSNIGKTTLLCSIIKFLKSNNIFHKQLLVFNKKKSICAIKYTKSFSYFKIVEDKTVLKQKGKDTQLMLNSGADKSLWVQSSHKDLKNLSPKFNQSLSSFDIAIIEGNGLIEFMKPDIVIFIYDSKDIKSSAKAILKFSDILITIKNKLPEKLINEFKNKRMFNINSFCEITSKIFLRKLLISMDKIVREKTIGRLLASKGKEQRILCKDAREIAEELGISYKKVGNVANELKIKIKDCELGCF